MPKTDISRLCRGPGVEHLQGHPAGPGFEESPNREDPDDRQSARPRMTMARGGECDPPVPRHFAGARLVHWQLLLLRHPPCSWASSAHLRGQTVAAIVGPQMG